MKSQRNRIPPRKKNGAVYFSGSCFQFGDPSTTRRTGGANALGKVDLQLH